MLLELRIGNLALAADVAVSLGPGLTAITGETGAGKSMIAGALALLGGGRADRDLVRGGEDLAFVEGVFDLADRDDLRATAARLGLPLGEDALLVVRREVRREGRSRVLINGLVSSLAVLERLGPQLLAVQSQDQQRELAQADFPREVLDQALGLEPERAAVADALEVFRQAVASLDEREQEAALAQAQLDMWRYQHDELHTAKLRDGECEELAEQIAVKRHAHDLQDAAAVALEHLLEGTAPACEALGAAESALAQQAARSPRLAAALENLALASDQAREAAHALSRFLDELDLDPRGLDELEERRALYDDLRRKYRLDVPGLLELQAQLAERLSRQERSEADLAERQAAVEAARERLARAADELGARRRGGARKVAARALQLIRPLALPNLELEFQISELRGDGAEIVLRGTPCRVEAHGADRVQMLVRTNPGESRGPVAELASGGERSRIHLGLTVMLQGQDHGPAMRLFDEVDAGLGMDAALPVAGLLRELAARGQVLCITHLPTMAVHAREHLVVTKAVRDGRTQLRVARLDGAGRVAEIARLLGGEGYAGGDQKAQLAYAQQLLAAGGRAAAGA